MYIKSKVLTIEYMREFMSSNGEGEGWEELKPSGLITKAHLSDLFLLSRTWFLLLEHEWFLVQDALPNMFDSALEQTDSRGYVKTNNQFYAYFDLALLSLKPGFVSEPRMWLCQDKPKKEVHSTTALQISASIMLKTMFAPQNRKTLDELINQTNQSLPRLREAN